MPRDAVSRTANVGTWLRKRNGGHKWVKVTLEGDTLENIVNEIYDNSTNKILKNGK